MGKLTKLFREVEGTDVVKQKYYAEKIVESFMLKEGKVAVAYDIEYIKEKIFIEAMKKSSLNESLKFVDDIDRQLDEGFFSALKDMGKAAWSGVKKVGKAIKDKIKGTWEGLKSAISPQKLTEIDKAIVQWNGEVSSLVTKHTGSAPATAVKESLIYKKASVSYLLEAGLPPHQMAEVEETETTEQNNKTPAQSTDPVKTGNDESKTQSDHVDDIYTHLKKGANYGPKAGFKFPDTKFYTIENGIVKVGPEKTNTPYKIAKIATNGLFFYFPAEFEGKPKFMGCLVDLIIGTMHLDEKVPAGKFKSKIAGVDVSSAGLVIYEQTEKEDSEPKTVGKLIAGYALKLFGDGQMALFKVGEDPDEEEVAPATPTGTEAPATPLSPKEEALALAKKNIDESIDSSGVKDNGDGFYTRMGLDPASVWAGFDKFAKRHAYNIVNILDDASKYNPAGKTAQHPAELQPLEYIAVLANMTSFINNLAADYTKTDPNIYNFLSAVGRASSTMNKVVDRGTLVSNAPAAAPAQKTEPTAKAPKTEADEKAFLASLL